MGMPGEGAACATCDSPVPAWPRVAVPQDDGSWLMYHDGCEPWRHPDVPPNEPSSPVPSHWRPALAAVVDRLVAKDYSGLAADGFIAYTSDPNDGSIGTWIDDYPATLVPLPDDAWEFAERGRCVDDPSVWWVVLDLWTAEEGRSDLSMEATGREIDGQLHVSITNVHVM